MQDAAAAAPTRGDHVVEHLVVDDVRDEIAGDPRAIQRRMHADQPVERAVAPELDRLARPPRRAPLAPLAPGDEGIDRPPEVSVVELLDDGQKVVVLALGEQSYPSPASCQPGAVGLDVLTYEGARSAIPLAEVSNQ